MPIRNALKVLLAMRPRCDVFIPAKKITCANTKCTEGLSCRETEVGPKCDVMIGLEKKCANTLSEKGFGCRETSTGPMCDVKSPPILSCANTKCSIGTECHDIMYIQGTVPNAETKTTQLLLVTKSVPLWP